MIPKLAKKTSIFSVLVSKFCLAQDSTKDLDCQTEQLVFVLSFSILNLVKGDDHTVSQDGFLTI